jgi:hypothetical protein
MTSSNPGPDHRSTGSMPDDTGSGSPEQKIREDARDAKREAGAQAREKVEAGQHQLADEADALSDAIDAAAANLDDHDREGLARYARDLSSKLASAAGQLEGRSVDELASDAKRLARNNPALFMLGSVAVGFGLSRFFKASAEHDHEKDDSASGNGAYRSQDRSPDDPIQTGSPGQQPHEPGMAATQASAAAPHSGDGREMS